MLIPHPVQHHSIVLFVFIGWEEEELKGHNTSRTTHSQQSTEQPHNACTCKVQEGWPPNPLLNTSSVSIEGGNNMGKGASTIGKDRGWGTYWGSPVP